MINLEKKTREIGSINFVAFSNNVVVVNTTPHPVTMQDMDGTLITVPTSMLINAKAEERKVSDLFVPDRVRRHRRRQRDYFSD